MQRHSARAERIALVARQLAKLKTEFVFTGGAIVGLLLTDSATPDVRPADNVDVIVGITRYADYAYLQEGLRKLGFSHDMDGPNCRFILDGLNTRTKTPTICSRQCSFESVSHRHAFTALRDKVNGFRFERH